MAVGDQVLAALSERGITGDDGLQGLTDDAATQVVMAAQWWQGLAEPTKKVMAKAADSDPESFSLATVGNRAALKVPKGVDIDTYLEVFVGALGDKGKLPVIVPTSPVAVFDPEAPAADSPFTIRWTEQNMGGPLGAFYNEIIISPVRSGGMAPPIARVDRPALGAGETRDAEHVLAAGLAPGAYTVVVQINAFDDSGPLGPTSGAGGVVQGQVVVGGVDDNSPAEALYVGVGEMIGILGGLPLSVDDVASAQAAARTLARAARRFARFVPDPWPATLAQRAGDLDGATFGIAAVPAVTAGIARVNDVSNPLNFAVQSAQVRGVVTDATDDLVAAATAFDAGLQQILAAR